jgi:hypothetical protein
LKRYAELGFSHLAITDHDAVLTKFDYAMISSGYSPIQVIPAIEVSTFAGHIILLNCKRRPWINSLFFLVIWSKFFNLEIYIPHPCRKGTGLLEEYKNNKIPTWYIVWFLKFVRFMEVHNPRDLILKPVIVDRKILPFLENLRWTVASDSHHEHDTFVDGCSMDGLEDDNPYVEHFFTHQIELGSVSTPFKFLTLLRYMKSSLKYLIKHV